MTFVTDHANALLPSSPYFIYSKTSIACKYGSHDFELSKLICSMSLSVYVVFIIPMRLLSFRHGDVWVAVKFIQ